MIDDSGFVGVFPGIGKGFVGLFTKFVIAFMDFFHDVSEGLRASSNPHRVYPSKERLPRHIGLDRILQEFNNDEAAYSEVLRTIDHNRYTHQTYVAYICKRN
jgi:vacuolar protein sorting-associated protein 13A/C